MGCAPSIHVSQSGIVYCREEIREPSSVRASSLSEVINHYHSEPGATAVTSTVRITRGRFSSVDKRKSVETETSFDLRKMDEISQVRLSGWHIIFYFVDILVGVPAKCFIFHMDFCHFYAILTCCILLQTGRKKRIYIWTDEALSKSDVGMKLYFYYAKFDINFELTCCLLARLPAYQKFVLTLPLPLLILTHLHLCKSFKILLFM